MRSARLELEAVSVADIDRLMGLLTAKVISWQIMPSDEHVQVYFVESEFGQLDVCIHRLRT
jgi:hypothetical protein